MQKIVPNLWFDDRAEEAMNFYVSVFKNARAGAVTRYGAAAARVSGKPEGSVLTATFEIEGQEFTALNGGPQFTFSEAVSFLVRCDTQEEIDDLWSKLTDGGEESMCGWLKDRFGVSWQIVPAALEGMIEGDDPARSERVMVAMLEMRKLDMARLEQAYTQR